VQQLKRCGHMHGCSLLLHHVLLRWHAVATVWCAPRRPRCCGGGGRCWCWCCCQWCEGICSAALGGRQQQRRRSCAA
jgi:hypothetical protein